MELQELKASTRKTSGKGGARQTRREGNIPGTLYGGGGEAVSFLVNSRELIHLIHGGGQGEHAVVHLNVEDDPALSSPAVLRSVQHHPVKGHVLHIDLQRIRLDEKMTTVVPVVLVGRPKGVIDGGVMDHQLREVEVECLATSVPNQLELDVTALEIGDSVHVGDLTAPEGVTIITESERTLAAVMASRLTKAAEEAEAAAEAEAAEAAEAAETTEGEEESS